MKNKLSIYNKNNENNLTNGTLQNHMDLELLNTKKLSFNRIEQYFRRIFKETQELLNLIKGNIDM